MGRSPIWITGPTRSGKTAHLVEAFCQWVKENQGLARSEGEPAAALTAAALILAANDDNRRNLSDRLAISTQGTYPASAKTPLGFISEEVFLFWPLLFEQLHIKAQFPLRLRPETEQELATRLWRPKLKEYSLQQSEINEYRFVRQTLDLLQLAGASGIPAENISSILQQGLAEAEALLPHRGELVLHWQQWCLQRGLLSYGLIYTLYWRYLLPNPQYQQHLCHRYRAIFADDVDDFPAIIRDLADFMLNQGIFGAFTYNIDGKVRLGLNADPQYLACLAARCQVRELSRSNELAETLTELAVQSLDPSVFITSLPEAVQSLQTTSRAQLLRQTANFIIHAIKRGEVQPQEIAIIAPGLDEIARYTFLKIFTAADIPVEPLNEQRPLISSPLIRGLLALLGLAYPGSGRLIRREDVAEMLVVLSYQETGEMAIDPARAGLIADYCYHIDPENPRLLPLEAFSRWDRLGHRTATAYRELVAWLEVAKSDLQQQRFPNPVTFLDRAIHRFVGNGSYLTYDRLAALRELMETAQHFWEVERRLRQHEPFSDSPTEAVRQFIQLLRRGTIAANPLPVRTMGQRQGVITLATVFQYRSRRSCHRWQFWLDAASNLWEKGGAAALFAAPLFLRDWSGYPISADEEVEADSARLQRILRDLLGRVGERVYLCHSDLSVRGTEQAGPLLTLVHASQEVIPF